MHWTSVGVYMSFYIGSDILKMAVSDFRIFGTVAEVLVVIPLISYRHAQNI